ncbi:Hpt domain-containing protein [Variovorax sp. J22G73]|uniref:hybrid sensor histidine kinase/response regulator n=1 Tax=unclassified Variovorax TaxID=663243 RepID=UPI000D5F425A|nr:MULTISPECIES: Hpt domain-containing protein [unclassified Variovorax]MDM0006940.1 Hpt domain-containing protein [Variovorax sp. J22R203]MDM0099308.1 Hpt domain-containing protein [Variovorax sp. J22G73]
MSIQTPATAPLAGTLPATEDLGPLAWVLGEIQKSLDGVGKSLRRFVRDVGAAAEPESGPLQMARLQLHQAVGALQMVGHPSPALVLGAIEFAVQGFIAEPQRCTDAAVLKIERAGFAVTDFLNTLLAGKAVSSVALFPQYRYVLELVGNERVHPADLWSTAWRWVEVKPPLTQAAIAYDPSVRSRLDREVLQVVKSGDTQAARRLQALCLGLGRGALLPRVASFWTLAAGFFEALAAGLVLPDAYVKRAASRVLLQYATLARGDSVVSDRLGQDLLFFCAQAVPTDGDDTATLRTVRSAWGIAGEPHVDYNAEQFGRFDPLVLQQARKRIETAKEMWSALSGGDITRTRQVADTFAQLGESLHKLHPPSLPMVQALTHAVEASLRSGQAPGTELAMEVATSVLYLEAALEDLDPSDPQLTSRTLQLAGRIERVRDGGHSEPLEPWMEDLYRRVSDRQTMGTVVDELRSHLSELEKSLDQYFRRPAEKGLLRTVPTQLMQMRGVFSVLGLEQAAHTVQRMRDDVEAMLVSTSPAEEMAGFDALGNNLGALGFLIDMLGYQPALAKRLFVFDDEAGELKPLMGRQATDSTSEDAASSQPPAVQSVLSIEEVDAQIASKLAALATPNRKAKVSPIEEFSNKADSWTNKISGPSALPDTEVTELEEDDLQNIFLDEAREVVEAGLAAIAELASYPDDTEELTILRRAFHTLKGSSRMVGLTDFGDAAWSLEQVLNTWLADQRAATPELLSGTERTLKDFSQWVEAIASGQAHGWQASQFSRVANALLAGEPVPPPVFVADAEALAVAARHIAAETPVPAPAPVASPAPAAPVASLPPLASVPNLPELPDLSLADEAPAHAPVAPVATAAPEGFETITWDEPPRAATPAALEADDDFASTDFLDFDAKQTTEPAPLLNLPSGDEFDFLAPSRKPAQAEPQPEPVVVEHAAAPEPELVLEPEPVAAPVEPAPEVIEATTPSETALPDFDWEPEPLKTAEPEAVEAVEAAQAPVEAPVAEFEPGQQPEPVATPEEPALALASESAPEAAQEPEAEPAPEPAAAEVIAPIFEAPSLPEEAPILVVEDVPEAAEAVEAPEPVAEAEVEPAPAPEAEPEPQPEPVAQVEAPQAIEEIAASAEDQVKVIGPLRIGIALYNVYLNEADEWSRQLATDVGEWSLESHERLPDSTIALAHSLAGSSATVGFHSLSGMARLLEAALQHLQMQGSGTREQGLVLVAAADELRRLLHQFAVGFLRDPAEGTLQALRDIAASPMPTELAMRAEARALPQVVVHESIADVALDDSEDAIDLADAVDVDLFPIFEEEAADLLPQLGEALRQWAHHPDDSAPRASVLRTLHTLKGSARLAGAMRLGERAHRMESEIETLGSQGAERADIEKLLVRLDALQATFDALRAADDATQVELAQIVASATASAPVAHLVQVATDAPANDESAAPASGDAEEAEATEQAAGLDVSGAPAPARLQPRPAPALLTPLRTATGQAVRIRTQLLDRLVAQTGEVIITRSRLEAELGQLRGSLADLTGNLDRLRQQLRDIEVQAESQMQSRLAQAKDSQQSFDPLEFDRFTRVQELTRMMAESVNDVATVQRTLQKTVQATEDDLSVQARQTRELQRGLLRTRMVEFEGISDRLYRVVRQASKDTGKQVRLDIVGGSIEMDRGVLDRMTPAFEHLLRNCVAHGIEDAAAREKVGKDASGLIVIDLHHEGNDVSVSFRDDGAGLDHKRIAERARTLGLLGHDEQLSPEDATELIFKPGFSTAGQVSELAGRGIGMDVVRSQIAAIGGRIETHSTAGQGTTFKLVLPLTTAVTHVVMLRAGEVSIGVPSNLVELVQRVSAADLEAAYRSNSHPFGSEQVPFYWAGALLQHSTRSEQVASRTNTLVVVRSAAQRVALHVDEVLGNQEVVVKNLGPQLARLPGLAGISVLASGAVALIYNPVALAAIHGDLARERQAAALVAPAHASADGEAGAPQAPVTLAPVVPQVPLVLVVDDSITVRRVTQRLLQREGYRVSLAADGLQALERLQQERPAVVLSDIEMPRMDGFDLARNIRADAALAELPIIMITSRIAEKHRDYARTLGVNHYLGKPYSEEELLRLVRAYTSEPALAAAA